ncbi:hypothetical protein Bbelb_104400 [Branchiostoma belcheri]|nr:hypothetical protein Bbelb_104400 [Branchiostoma belcheri]
MKLLPLRPRRSASPPPRSASPPQKICFAPVVPLRPRRNSALPPSFCLAPNGGTTHSRHENHDFRVDCELCRHWGLSRRTGAKQNCAGGVEERRGRSRFFAGAKQNGAGAKQNGGGEEEGVSWGAKKPINLDFHIEPQTRKPAVTSAAHHMGRDISGDCPSGGDYKRKLSCPQAKNLQPPVIFYLLEGSSNPP